jgi:hypothetical protein
MHMHFILKGGARISARPFILQSPCRIFSPNTLLHIRQSSDQAYRNRPLQRAANTNNGVQPDSSPQPSSVDTPSLEQNSSATFRYAASRPRTELGERESQSIHMAYRIKLHGEEENGGFVESEINLNRTQSQNTISSDRPNNGEETGDFSEFLDDLESLVRHGLPITSSRIELPMSPLLDPNKLNIKYRKKNKPSEDLTPFQRKLAGNVYANAIASPVRVCQLTKTALPKFFLQKIRLVTNLPGKASTHPAQFIPGDIVSSAAKRFYKMEGVEEPPLEESNSKIGDGLNMSERIYDDTNAHDIVYDRQSSSSGLGVYVLARQAAISVLAESRLKDLKYPRRILIPPSQSKDNKALKLYRTAWFNPDMHEFILSVLRQQVCGGLLGLANLRKGYLNSFDTWDTALSYSPQTSALLWLGRDGLLGADDSAPPKEFATILHKSRPMSIPKKIPVHNLKHLLGQKFLASLKQRTKQIPMFHQPIVALKRRNMTTTTELQLWELQGYVAEHATFY